MPCTIGEENSKIDLTGSFDNVLFKRWERTQHRPTPTLEISTMARSVALPADASIAFYIDASWIDEREQWEQFIEELQWFIRERYPSFNECDRPVGRECWAILENRHARIVVSEYCGLVSVSIVQSADAETYDYRPLAEAWIDRATPGIRAILAEHFGLLRRIGTASNGASFYERVS